MSRTDHARPRRVMWMGHRTSITRVQCFDGTSRWQATCSCGLRGAELHIAHPGAERDAYGHRQGATNERGSE